MGGLRPRPLGRRRYSAAGDRSGFSVVEFAILAPVVILLTLGIVDLGRLAWTASALDQSAREAARYAALHGSAHPSPATVADIKSSARSHYVGLEPDRIIPTVTWSPSNSPGGLVTVTVSTEFHLFTYGILTGRTVTLSGESTVTVLGR